MPELAPSLDDADGSGIIGCSRRIGIRALLSSDGCSALGVAASFCVIVGSCGASVGAWASALAAPNTVAATAVNIIAFVSSLLVDVP